MANTTHSLGSVSPTNTVAAGSNNQSGRPAPTADQRPQTKLVRLYQTNNTMCGTVALFFKQRGDWLCTLIYSCVYLREEDLVKARRLSQPREQCCAMFHDEWTVCTQYCCPPWIIISMRAAINHFYCDGNIYCASLPFVWQMPLS